jgi:subtilisin family serine protease
MSRQRRPHTENATVNLFRKTLIAAAVGVALLHASTDLSAAAGQTPAHGENYIVRFDEAGLLHFAGGIDGLRATAPAVSGARKLDATSADALAYRQYLEDRRAEHVATIVQALGHGLDLHHSYAITMNGIAAELTADEAARVASLPGVASVRRAGVERLHTYRGPTFIGADAVWNGAGTRGQGVVIGVIDSGAHSTHPAFANDPHCGHDGSNPKLLGAVDCSISTGGFCAGTNPEANSGNGHGVHVAGTAAGNTLDANASPAPIIPAPHTQISGVAPCAQVRSYKVCETNSCEGTAILAAIENAIADRVDVINYSISGGNVPWLDDDRSFLDAVGADIFVAASAGNTGAVTDPVGQVNHLGPWVMSVAAVSHDENAVGTGVLSVVGPGTPPAGLGNIALRPGSGVRVGEPVAGVPLRSDATNLLGCTPFATDYFAGAIALISRGDCPFEAKINNAQAAGAQAAVIYNNQDAGIFMLVGSAQLPAYLVTQTQGQSLLAFIGQSAPQPVTVNFTPALQQGDTLAEFSLRGPTGGAYGNLSKPDIAAPGISIYAAMDAGSGEYTYLSGTSMASPHVAGAAALVRAAHPGWTSMEVKSALQTTASVDGYKDNTVTAWDSDDVGSGRVAVARAVSAGLLLDESYAKFLAANPDAGTLPMTALNLPSLRNVNCSPSCTFTRTVTNRLATAGDWQVSYEGLSGDLRASVTPDSFTLAPGESQTLSITLAPPHGVVMHTPGFGRLLFTESQQRSPQQHFTVVIGGTGSFNFVDVQTASVTATDQCQTNPQAGNGVIEPGETVRLAVPLRARGGDFSNVRATLRWPPPPGVSYLNGSAIVGAMNIGSTVSAGFMLQIDPGYTCLSDFTLPIEISSDQGTYETAVSVAVGLDHFEPVDVPQAIADGDPAGSVSQLTIAQSVSVADLRVRVALEHAWVGDLTVKLRSPAGTEIVLLDRPGYPLTGEFGCGNRDVVATFSDDVSDPESVCASGIGSPWPVTDARPTEPLSAFDGENTQGVWTLTAVDSVVGFSGRIASWTLLPEPAFQTICTVCADTAEIVVFADDFEGDLR